MGKTCCVHVQFAVKYWRLSNEVHGATSHQDGIYIKFVPESVGLLFTGDSCWGMRYTVLAHGFRNEWRFATTHPKSICLVHSFTALWSKRLMFSLWVVAEMSVAATNSSPVFPPIASSPPHRARHALPRGNHLLICGLCVSGINGIGFANRYLDCSLQLACLLGWLLQTVPERNNYFSTVRPVKEDIANSFT
jgi:hypothetical protein